MFKYLKIMMFSIASLAFATNGFAAEGGTADEASAMVKRGVAYAKSNGKEKLLAEVLNTKGKFVDRDLYLSVWDLKATVLAHGANAKMVGKNITELKDADGKFFMKEIVSKAEGVGSGWVDYKWVNPVTKEIQSKSAYFEKVDDMIVSAGYYKK